MSQGGPNKKVSNSLLALSSAAILAVYTAGYSRTRSAADRFAAQAEGRSPAVPVARGDAPPLASVPVASPAKSAPSDVKRKVAVRPSPAPAEVSSATSASAPAPSPVETPAPIPSQAAEPAPVAEVPAATTPAAAPAAPTAPPKPVWKDGTYTGWGTSRHGDIQAAVVIEGGRIASATIAQCLTRYSCSVIEKLPPQPADRQSPDVDSVSGATQSADAFYYAVVEALAKAK